MAAMDVSIAWLVAEHEEVNANGESKQSPFDRDLTRDPDLRYIPSGAAVANFGLAINRAYTDSNGEKMDDVCFVDVVAWNRLAEVCGEYLAKGRPVFIEGRLQYRSWESENGGKRSKLEVVAQNIQFLGGAAKAESESGEDTVDDEVPF